MTYDTLANVYLMSALTKRSSTTPLPSILSTNVENLSNPTGQKSLCSLFTTLKDKPFFLHNKRP